MVSSSINDQMKYYGRREICLLMETSVQSLFRLSLSTTASSSKPIPTVSEFVAYILHRTALPNQTIFHALHLLRRISALYDFPSTPSTPLSPLAHHRLVLSSIILATIYHMDNPYSNRSWSIATKELFSLEEINEMEFEMLECLDWKIGEDGVSSIVELIGEYEVEFLRWEEEVRHGAFPSPSKFLSIDDSHHPHLSKSTSLVEVASATVNSSSPISGKTTRSISTQSTSPKRSGSIWSHFSRLRCPHPRQSQMIPGFGNLVSLH